MTKMISFNLVKNSKVDIQAFNKVGRAFDVDISLNNTHSDNFIDSYILTIKGQCNASISNCYENLKNVLGR